MTLGDWKEPEGEKFALGAVEEQAHWQAEYHRLVRDTVERERAFPGRDADTAPRTIGMRIPRNDALYKVRGRARYAGNIEMEGMLHGRFVRSPHPHARIQKIDTSRAEAVPGVKGILTGAEIPDDRLLVGPISDDTPVLARDKVRFAGEPVVAIVAETERQAEAACLLVEVEYEPLETVVTPEQALAEGTARIDPEDGNVITDLRHGRATSKPASRKRTSSWRTITRPNPSTIASWSRPAGVAFVDRTMC